MASSDPPPPPPPHTHTRACLIMLDARAIRVVAKPRLLVQRRSRRLEQRRRVRLEVGPREIVGIEHAARVGVCV